MGLESLDSEGKKEEEVTVTVKLSIVSQQRTLSDTKGHSVRFSARCAYVLFGH